MNIDQPEKLRGIITAAAKDGRAVTLDMWTVYDRPSDYPAGLIARRWVIKDNEPEPVATADTLTGATLDEIRRKIRAWFSDFTPGISVVIPRSRADDLPIVETWL